MTENSLKTAFLNQIIQDQEFQELPKLAQVSKFATDRMGIQQELEDSVGQVEIKIYYTEEELTSADPPVNESGLKIYYFYYFDKSSNTWKVESNSGVNTTENYVWAKTNHLSFFGVAAIGTTTIFPKIDRIEPSKIEKKSLQNLQQLVILGSGFIFQGSQVYLYSKEMIPLSIISQEGDFKIIASLPSNLEIGSYDLIIQNTYAGGNKDICEKCFEIVEKIEEVPIFGPPEIKFPKIKIPITEKPKEIEYIYYTVKRGDSLKKIAREVWGNGDLWYEIIQQNKDTYPQLLKNPNVLYRGWVFKLTSKPPATLTPVPEFIPSPLKPKVQPEQAPVPTPQPTPLPKKITPPVPETPSPTGGMPEVKKEKRITRIIRKIKDFFKKL